MNDPIQPDDDRVTLSPKDAAIVDSLLEEGVGAHAGLHLSTHDRPAACDPQRTARVQAWLKLVGAAEAPQAPADLLQRTLGAVEEDRMKLAPAAELTPMPIGKDLLADATRRLRSRRLAEIAAMVVAAGLLVAVIIPAMSQMHQSDARVACSNNLKTFGTGMATYAAAFSNQLPALAMPNNLNWMHGDSAVAARSNAAHLLPLVEGKFITLANLYCAGSGVPEAPALAARNDLPNIGYSYVNLYGPTRPTWDGLDSTLILADRNPLFPPPHDPPIDPAKNPDVNSANHGGHGNYILRADKSVAWTLNPNVGPGGDNIWTLGSGNQRRSRYIGTETAALSGNVFLAP